MKSLVRWYEGLDDHDAETLRVWHKRLLVLWVFPGLPISILLAKQIWYVTAISVYTIIAQHFIGMQEKQDEA